MTKEVSMKPGSIVELSKTLTDIDLELLRERGVSITKNTPYVIKNGPKLQLWIGTGVASVILLEEIPELWVNCSYFSELQAPGEVSLSEILTEPMRVAV